MAYVSETPRVAGGFTPAWFSAMVEAYRIVRIRREAYRRTFNELSAMNDKELADIGLSSLMVRDIARQAAAMAA
ncbi:DUF1127 domain-containing protein [Aliiruegeria lutimaris]|uniref:YjiS-like domain-containing protein n=1 Tax=Aliiruegeria lutimaris TaxID=571298 RepID=A0A1G8XTD1_9RHOB|nr:DUF1127 domain-containing protein [Aliiruegeria lutimaris]SDJ93778.1 protein of unknown function [Aliiruegeria lutimaris]